MPKKNIPDAKNRILQAALKVFAEKSFEGSRVDDISLEANVPKSLIYYHFRSKNEIFDTLVSEFLKKFMAIAQASANETDDEKAQNISNRLQHRYFEFAYQNTDLIRIILLDSLKKSTKEPAIYRIAESMVNADENIAQSSGINRSERLIAEFFTNVLPNCAVLCLSDTFIKYFDIDQKVFGKLYTNIMEITHGAYHKARDQNNFDEGDAHHAENES